MTIIQGDCGGITFRDNSANGKFYFIEVCQDGTYALKLYVNNTNADAQKLVGGSSQQIHTGLNQSNVMAVVANANRLDLYVNRQKIDSVSDGTYSHGQVGVAVESSSNPTEVVFSDAKAWKL